MFCFVLFFSCWHQKGLCGCGGRKGEGGLYALHLYETLSCHSELVTAPTVDLLTQIGLSQIMCSCGLVADETIIYESLTRNKVTMEHFSIRHIVLVANKFLLKIRMYKLDSIT